MFATYPFGRVSVAFRGEPDIAEGIYVTGDYYTTLRLAPAAGRLLDANDDRSGVAVAVLGHRYWQRRFGGRHDVIGAAVTLNGIPFTVVGVEPATFAGTEVGRPYRHQRADAGARSAGRGNAAVERRGRAPGST